VNILIISNNLLTRAGLAALLETQETYTVVGQTSSNGLLDDIDLTQPDIVLCDMGWQADLMLDALETLVGSDYPLVILLTERADAERAAQVVAAFPTYGILLHDNDSSLLTTALQTVYAGLIVIDPELSDDIISDHSIAIDPLPEALTPREDDVLQLLADGMTNKAIAHQLGITDHTVKFHVNAIMTKLGAQSRTEAVVRATRAGLIIL
jgi:DNA-binding NarL/FixJ family response regulator